MRDFSQTKKSINQPKEVNRMKVKTNVKAGSVMWTG